MSKYACILTEKHKIESDSIEDYNKKIENIIKDNYNIMDIVSEVTTIKFYPCDLDDQSLDF